MQQGRIQVDSDWNEQEDINTHFKRLSLQDIIGRSGAPANKAGFSITPFNHTFKIGAGHYYVDGIICENEQDIEVDLQPDLPCFYSDNIPCKTESGIYLVYLDVWERHLTALDDPQIIEPALGGADTATRSKIVWQVKQLRLENVDEDKPISINSLPDWNNLTKKVTGSIEVRLKPGTGYQGCENQLYRVEIHNSQENENNNKATFKWSRDNGTIVAKVTDISGLELSIAKTNLLNNKLLAFEPGQWIEVIDDYHELCGISGTLIKLDSVKENILTFNSDSIDGDLPTNENFPQRFNPKVRRWDSVGSIKTNPSSADAENDFIPLEYGIEVKFNVGTYRSGDYWLIPARVVNKNIEWPTHAAGVLDAISPQGIEHHFCELGLIKYDDTGNVDLVSDCRKLFSPLTNSHLYAYTGISSSDVEARSFKIIGPIYHNLKLTLPSDKTSIVPAVILGEIRDNTDMIEEDSTNNNKSIRYIGDFALLSLINAEHKFDLKEDSSNSSDLSMQLGIRELLLSSMSSDDIPIFFKVISVDQEKFYILLVNYNKKAKSTKLRWWAIPAIAGKDGCEKQ